MDDYTREYLRAHIRSPFPILNKTAWSTEQLGAMLGLFKPVYPTVFRPYRGREFVRFTGNGDRFSSEKVVAVQDGIDLLSTNVLEAIAQRASEVLVMDILRRLRSIGFKHERERCDVDPPYLSSRLAMVNHLTRTDRRPTKAEVIEAQVFYRMKAEMLYETRKITKIGRELSVLEEQGKKLHEKLDGVNRLLRVATSRHGLLLKSFVDKTQAYGLYVGGSDEY